ncbi:hypothetical protein [uncultured Pseudokineococcus sp.]|uniref:hypothetical protein n=1 Tax=uncultured Pseudokineococcus sp. TaxID=1642928 RepID=UPI00260A7579|nr:hypothetical protein [uncultured Pseudokineococcus sp.]
MSGAGGAGRGGGSGLSFEDTLWLVGAAALAVSVGLVDPAGIATSALGWLVDHHVLVPREQALVPLVGDSGLDLRRVVGIAAALVLVALLVRGRARRGDAAAAGPAGPPAGRV